MSLPAPALELALVLLSAVVSAIAGWHAARRVPRKRAMLAAAGFVLVAWPILSALFPDRLYAIYPAFPYGESLFGAAFFLPGVLASAYADTALRRVLQGVLAVGVTYYALAEPLWFALHSDQVRQLEGSVQDGVTLQTEFYTCMPSALATVLRRWGHEMSEGEAAYRLRTTFQGTRPMRVPQAVQALREDLSARIADTTLDDLLRAGRPAILVGWTGSVRHAVALLELDDRNVGIGDPLRGFVRVPRNALDREFRWNGQAILIEARHAGAGGPKLTEKPEE